MSTKLSEVTSQLPGSTGSLPNASLVLLRVQLPSNNTSVMQFSNEITMGEIISQICIRKDISIQPQSSRVVYDGKEEAVLMHRTLSSYPRVERLILRSSECPPAQDGNSLLPPDGQRRRTSILNSSTSKQTTILNPQEFPETLTDHADLTARIHSMQKSAESSKMKNRVKIKTLSMLFFKKHSDTELPKQSGSFTDSMLAGRKSIDDIAQTDTPITPKSGLLSQSVLDSQQNTPSASMYSPDSSRKLLLETPTYTESNFDAFVDPIFSSREDSKTSKINSAETSLLAKECKLQNRVSCLVDQVKLCHSDGNLRRDRVGFSVNSLDQSSDTGEGAEEPKLTSAISASVLNQGTFEKTLRKRVNSGPISVLTARGSMANLSTPSKSKSVNREYEEMNSDPNAQKLVLKVQLPDNQTTTVKVAETLNVTGVLYVICEKRNLDMETHRLELRSSPGTPIDTDKCIKDVVQEADVTEVCIVRCERPEQTICISENDKDVLILKITSDGKQVLMAGTHEKLIERATDPTIQDDDFIDKLLMSFRSFLKPIEFFDHLLSRFHAELPLDPTEEDIIYFQEMNIPIKKKVLRVFTWWAEHHWHDFGLNSKLRVELDSFAESMIEIQEFREQGEKLQAIIQQQSEAFEALVNDHVIQNTDRRGKAMESMILLASPENISQQLCLHNYNLFKNVHPVEVLNQIWTKTDESISPSLDFFIARFDKESYWTATEIVTVKDFKKRVNVLKNLILAAKQCKDYNNFFSMFAIVAGLNLTPVQRLKKTWEGLSERTKKTFAELEKLTDPSKNMKNFRDLLNAASPPIVPFLPIYLKDLTFMNDGNQSTVRGMINFDKLRMMATRVTDITALVNVPYNFEVESALQNYISKPPVEKNLAKLKELAAQLE